MIDERKLLAFIDARREEALSQYNEIPKEDRDHPYLSGKIMVYIILEQKIRAGEFE